MTYNQHTCYYVSEDSILEVNIEFRTPIFC